MAEPQVEPPRSITVMIDPASKDVQIAFVPQELMPNQYGAVISSVIVHIARCFMASNPGVPEEKIIQEIVSGIEAGIAQRDACSEPSVQH